MERGADVVARCQAGLFAYHRVGIARLDHPLGLAPAQGGVERGLDPRAVDPAGDAEARSHRSQRAVCRPPVRRNRRQPARRAHHPDQTDDSGSRLFVDPRQRRIADRAVGNGGIYQPGQTHVAGKGKAAIDLGRSVEPLESGGEARSGSAGTLVRGFGA